MLRPVVCVMSLAACSPAVPIEAPLTTVRGDPRPPAWATPDLGWVGHAAYARIFDGAAEVMPADLAHHHVVCSLVARQDGNPADGARDLAMRWRFGAHDVARLCNVDESPCTTGFTEGLVHIGDVLSVFVVDEDDPDADDELGTFEGSVVAGQSFVVDAPELTIHCRAATPDTVRAGFAKLLREELPRRVADLTKMKGERRDGELYALRNFVTRAAGIAGWGHPDVWPLVNALAE